MNFVLWGLYFALLLVLEKAFLLRILEKLPRAAGHLYTMLAVIISWAIFALDTDAIIPYLKTMLGIGAPAIYDLDALYMLSGNALFFAVLAVGSTGMVSALYRKFFSRIRRQRTRGIKDDCRKCVLSGAFDYFARVCRSIDLQSIFVFQILT